MNRLSRNVHTTDGTSDVCEDGVLRAGMLAVQHRMLYACVSKLGPAAQQPPECDRRWIFADTGALLVLMDAVICWE